MNKPRIVPFIETSRPPSEPMRYVCCLGAYSMGSKERYGVHEDPFVAWCKWVVRNPWGLTGIHVASDRYALAHSTLELHGLLKVRDRKPARETA